MRICHVSPHLPPDQAANALLPAELGAWARARGHDVAFVTREPAQGGTSADPLPGPVIRVSGHRSRSATLRLLRIDTWRRSREITEALDENARTADVLHLHSNGLIVEVAAAWSRRRKMPFLLTLYGTEIWHYRRRWPIDPFTHAYRHAAEVTFYSQRLLDRARELGLERPRLSVIYPAVSESFVPHDDQTRAQWRAVLGIAEQHVIVNVKRLHELAGQRFLIEAFARLCRERSDVRLVVCGTGPLRTELEQQARREGVAARVTFTGLVPNDRVAKYVAVADVFALPSLLEALPTVAIEALASGTPVVSADHPGGEELHELFGDDVEIVPRRDARALASALVGALQNPRRTRSATAEVVNARFRPTSAASAYFAAYERVLRPPSSHWEIT